MEQRLLENYENNGELESDGTATKQFTAEEVIESMKWGRFQYFMLLISGIFTVVEAFEVMMLTVLFPVIQCEWQLTALQSAMLSVFVFAGMLCGSPIWGVLSDKYGRKPIMYAATALIATFGFLCSFSPNIIALFILRFLVGAAISGNIQMSVLMVEYVGSKYRAIMVVSSLGFWAIGSLLEVLLAWQIIPTIGWRYLVAISALPVALSLLTWPGVPESARFLLVSGQKEKATKILNKVVEMNHSTLPPGKLRGEIEKERGRVSDLFHPDYRRTTLQLIVIWTTSIACYFGTSLATTELLRISYCAAAGAAGAAAPSSDATSSSDGSDGCENSLLSSNDYGQIAVTSVAELFIMPIGIFLADRLGRRNTMTMCQLLVAIPYFLLLTCTASMWNVTALLFIARGFAGTVTTIIYLYTPEIYPTQCRAVGLSCCYIAGRIGAILTPLISQVLLRTSVHSALLTYGGMSLLGAIASHWLPFETKGRRMQ